MIIQEIIENARQAAHDAAEAVIEPTGAADGVEQDQASADAALKSFCESLLAAGKNLRLVVVIEYVRDTLEILSDDHS